jgi:hypothetical protein
MYDLMWHISSYLRYFILHILEMTLDIAVAVYNYSINVYLKLFHYFGISYISCSIRVKSYTQTEVQLLTNGKSTSEKSNMFMINIKCQWHIKNKWHLILDFQVYIKQDISIYRLHVSYFSSKHCIVKISGMFMAFCTNV